MVVDAATEDFAQRLALKIHRLDIIGHIENKSNLSTKSEEIELNAFANIEAGNGSVTTDLTEVVNDLRTCPELLKRLVEEIRTIFRKEYGITRVITAKSRFLNAVLHEGMRTCPQFQMVRGEIVLPARPPPSQTTSCQGERRSQLFSGQHTRLKEMS